MEIPYLFIGILIGTLFSGFIFLLVRNKDRETENLRRNDLQRDNENMLVENRVASEKILSLEKRLSESMEILGRKEDSILDLSARLSARNAEYAHIKEKCSLWEKDRENLFQTCRMEFKNLANDIMEEKSRKFTIQNKENLSAILGPLNEKIRDFEKQVVEVYDKEARERFSLQREIRHLADLNQKISSEANNLASALKGQSKLRGTWGEMILESILEKSGLAKGREFFVQTGFSMQDGRTLQPDVVVNYPGERNLVVDAKVSLVAYERYCRAESDTDRDIAARDHLRSVRTHIDGLSGKNYQDLPSLRSPDFVLLFMPVEPAYLLAIQTDEDLWSYAYDRRILLIGPTNLIAVLKMVSCLWQQEYQSRNVQEIARQGGALYDKFVGFVEAFEQVGKTIDQSKREYEKAMGRLSKGRGNLIRRSEKLRELGANTKKQMPVLMADSREGEK